MMHRRDQWEPHTKKPEGIDPSGFPFLLFSNVSLCASLAV